MTEERNALTDLFAAGFEQARAARTAPASPRRGLYDLEWRIQGLPADSGKALQTLARTHARRAPR
jgi:hypothetical protein